MSFQTDLLNHIPIDPLTGAIAVPIYQTSTFVQEAPGVNKGYDYSRTNNPTREVLENLCAKLENGAGGFAFSSGMAAIDAVVKLLSSGDEIIAVADIYGGAYRLFEKVYSKFGIKTHYVDTSDLTQVEKAITSRTKLFWIETPTNPTLKITDLRALSQIAKEHNILLCVDNTFATPVSQRPLDLGADLVVHSVTKYLAGHSDVIAGLVVAKTEELAQEIRFYQNACGAVLGPFDSFLTVRGIETLQYRYQAHCDHAQKIAEFLEGHELVRRVYYPGLPSHPGYGLAGQQQKYAGAIISFDLHEDRSENALAIIRHLKQFKLAESLGGIKSLVSLPCEMSHKTLPECQRQQSGISDSLIRLSVGLEDVQDLIRDLEQALEYGQSVAPDREQPLEQAPDAATAPFPNAPVQLRESCC
ncbi:MAG TPA: PLP-dependent aspartate aminotransferase family protein [Sphingobacteriaceae bacterium]|nr:PLP-dependent aspartate aminotransferase family protein [Sphingobacteriaceae bacterium]